MPEELNVRAMRHADVTETLYVDGRRGEEARVLAGEAERAHPMADERRHEALVRAARQRHPHDVDVSRARDAPSANELRLDAERTL